MFTFIHTYAPGVFPALEKSGLWRQGDGLKLMHKPGFLPPHDFNTALAPGSPLSALLRELKCPFYVDRLQGGVGYTNRYPYDEGLIGGLRDLLGDGFWGFQMHEWASNLNSDIERIRRLFTEQGAAPEDPAAWERLWDRIEAGSLPLFLETYPPSEWRRLKLPENLAAFLRSAQALYRRRAFETDGLLLPADSYFMAPGTEIELGAKRLTPEAGWQIPNLRVQLAFTRGMAKAAGIPWGIYYECWQNTEGVGFTIPYALRSGQDEWREDLLVKGCGAGLPFAKREHGGSSLSLMARAWRLAYFSGAGSIAEEYGVCNTFRDLDTAELSPYGEEKRAFLRFAEAFPDIGVPFTPVAVVLPSNMPMLDVTFGDRYLGHSLSDPAAPLRPDGMRRFYAAMGAVFGKTGKYGNMGHVIKNGGLPGVCDVIYEDSPTISSYEMLIDPTGDDSFPRRHKNAVTPEEADRRLNRLLPCRVGGGLFAAYNKTARGWYVLVMNSDGVQHNVFSPDVLLPEAAVRTELTLRTPGSTVSKAAGNGTISAVGGRYALTLSAGEWLLLRLA